MSNLSTLSVTKGCFVYKPPARDKKTKSKNVDVKNECFGTLYSDHDLLSQLRYQTFSSHWKRAEEHLNVLQDGVHRKVFGDFVAYLQTARDNGTSFRESEIPAAALLTGVNMPDHGTLFSIVTKLVEQLVTPYVVSLSSKECGNIRQTVQLMVARIISEGRDVEADSDDASSDEEKGVQSKVFKKSQCTMPVLKAWYSSQSLKKKSPKKRKSEQSEEKPMVVILEDFESFRPSVLQDLILILSGYHESLPIVLVFGVATTIAALHHSLSHHVSSLLSLRIFQSQPSSVCLNLVIERVVLNPEYVFKLGSKTFRLLLDVFLFHDFSVEGFIKSLKFSMMEHFFSNPHSLLCCNEDELQERVQIMKDAKALDCCRHLPSFRAYVESQPVKRQAALLTNDEVFSDFLFKSVLQLHKKNAAFFQCLKCLHALTADLPKAPLGKQLRELYAVSLAEPVGGTSEFADAFLFLRLLSRQELINKLSNIKEVLQPANLKSSWQKDLNEAISKWLNTLEDCALETDTFESTPLSTSEGKIDRLQLKEQLLELSRNQKPLNAYESLRSEVVEHLRALFSSENASPPTSLVFHEILYFDGSASIRRHLVAAPRAAIQTALADPQSYLQCSCCQLDDPGQILATMPDLSVCYKLHAECGRLVNLYDWLQAFLTIVNPDENNEERRNVDPELQARFIQAVAELQFLGFIKSSRRKTDHVTKMTWGGYV